MLRLICIEQRASTALGLTLGALHGLHSDSGQPHCTALLMQIVDGSNMAASSLWVSWMKTSGPRNKVQGVSVYVDRELG